MKPSEQDWESFQISVCPLVLTHHTEKGDGRESAVFYSLRLQFHCRKPPASKSRHSLYFRNPFKPNKAAYLLPRLSESINKIKATRFGWVSENNSSFNQGGGPSPLPDTLSIQGRIWKAPTVRHRLWKDSYPHEWRIWFWEIQRKEKWRDGGKGTPTGLCLSEPWAAIVFIYKISRADGGRATERQRRRL